MPLHLALYGHPDSGGYWEQRADRALNTIGFEDMVNWPSMYWHPVYKMMLMVYVDDFKMSGPLEHMPKVWEMIKEGIKLDTPKAVNKCLGCTHKEHTLVVGAIRCGP